MKRKALILGLPLLLTIALTAGCGQDSDTGESSVIHETSPDAVHGDLHVWSWNVAAESLKAIAPTYEQTHPHVKVDVDMTGANMTMRLMLSLAANTGAPDISQLQLLDAPHYMATGRLADLTPVAAKYQKFYPPAVWQNCVLKGHVYAIPWDMGPCAIFYKRKIWAQYGVDPSQIDTWDDYIAAGKKILKLSHGQTKMLPLASTDLQSFFFVLLQQTGGQVFDSQGRIAIDSPQSLAALDIIRKLVSAGICSDVTAYSQEWMAGMNDASIASYPGAVWMGGMIEDTSGAAGAKGDEWSVARLPAIVHGGLHVANSGGSVLVIPSQCTQKDAAWSFIEWALASKEGQEEQYDKKSLFPSFLPAMHSDDVSAPQPFFGGQRDGALFATDVEKIPQFNMTPQTAESNDYISQALSHWCATGMNDPHLLRDLAAKLSERLDVPIAPGAVN